MAKKKRGQDVPLFEFHLDGRTYVQTDIDGKPIYAVIDGEPMDATRPDLLSAAQKVELQKLVEADRRDFHHSRYLDLEQNDPRFSEVKRRMQTGLHPHDAVLADSDPEAFSEIYDKVRGKVGRSDEERDAIAAREERAEQAQEEYLSGTGGLDALAELIDARGAAKAIVPPKPARTEEQETDDEMASYHDESVAEAVRDRARFHRDRLEERAKGGEKLSTDEVSELLQHRETAGPDDE